MSYMKADVEAAKAKIAAACPDVILEDWQDFGWRLTGYLPGPHCVRTLFQPERIHQDEIVADVNACIREWQDTARRLKATTTEEAMKGTP